MNKSRIIYIAGAIIAVAVLIWDKTANQDSISAPQDAGAYPVGPQRVAPTGDPAETSSESLEDMDELSNIPPMMMKSESPFFLRMLRNITQKLIGPPRNLAPSLPEDSFTRDLFMATDEFASAINLSESTEHSKEGKNGANNNYAQHAKTLQLSGILIGTHGAYAIIDQEVIYQGQHIGPYHLLEINSDSVMLGIENERMLLYLEE